MHILKTAVAVALSTLIWMVPPCGAVMEIQNSGPAVTAPSGNSLVKVTGFVVKIQDHVLYLENNKRYDLRNVKLTDLSRAGKAVSKKKRMAEMVFINGALKEVVIR